jgi:hypothetical protein
MKARGRSAFGHSVRNRRAQTDSHPSSLKAKIEIRERVLAAIGAEAAHVFDGFAGEGILYRQVWKRAASYVGCDLRWYKDERLLYVCDSARLMRCIELEQFNVFDFDSYGAPWLHVIILCARRRLEPGERIGLVLTEGSSLKVKLGSLPRSLAELAKLRLHTRGTAKAFDEVINRAISGMCSRLGCRPVKRWQTQGKTGAGVRYIGLVLEGNSPDSAQRRSPGPFAWDDNADQEDPL